MKDARVEPQPSAPTAIESVGLACARAAMVAMGVGMLEGTAIGRRIGAPTAGMGLATSGLWLPAALLALMLVAMLRRALMSALEAASESAMSRARNAGLMALAALFFFALVFWMKDPAAESTFGSPLHAAPLELITVAGLAWGASMIRPEGSLRRVAAIGGVVVAVFVQLFANRWVDAHGAMAGALGNASFVPGAMLRYVLQRLV